MSGANFSYFMESLETLENLLHAETQAIAAQHLDTIDSIMLQKDESLRIVTKAKQMLNSDPRLNDVANQQINYVLNLQAKNADSFKRLKDKVMRSSNDQIKDSLLQKSLNQLIQTIQRITELRISHNLILNYGFVL